MTTNTNQKPITRNHREELLDLVLDYGNARSTATAIRALVGYCDYTQADADAAEREATDLYRQIIAATRELL
jgi:hypothetical protein